jgi:imidazole glycerol phosphate synthase subunit HisF
MMLTLVPAWKARFGFQCISTVIQHAQTAKVPKYSVVIELDRKIRDMELPKYAQRPPREGAELGEAMKQCPVTTDTSVSDSSTV